MQIVVVAVVDSIVLSTLFFVLAEASAEKLHAPTVVATAATARRLSRKQPGPVTPAASRVVLIRLPILRETHHDDKGRLVRYHLRARDTSGKRHALFNATGRISLTRCDAVKAAVEKRLARSGSLPLDCARALARGVAA